MGSKATTLAAIRRNFEAPLLPANHPLHKIALKHRLVEVWQVLWVIFVFFVMLVTPGAISTLFMLTGNAILRHPDTAHYANDQAAALVGLTGGVVVGIIFYSVSAFFLWCQDIRNPPLSCIQLPCWASLIFCTCFGVLAGSIGAAIVGNESTSINAPHGARAGALGGTILGCGFLLPMLWDLLATVFVLVQAWWVSVYVDSLTECVETDLEQGHEMPVGYTNPIEVGDRKSYW